MIEGYKGRLSNIIDKLTIHQGEALKPVFLRIYLGLY